MSATGISDALRHLAAMLETAITRSGRFSEPVPVSIRHPRTLSDGDGPALLLYPVHLNTDPVLRQGFAERMPFAELPLPVQVDVLGVACGPDDQALALLDIVLGTLSGMPPIAINDTFKAELFWADRDMAAMTALWRALDAPLRPAIVLQMRILPNHR